MKKITFQRLLYSLPLLLAYSSPIVGADKKKEEVWGHFICEDLTQNEQGKYTFTFTRKRQKKSKPMTETDQMSLQMQATDLKNTQNLTFPFTLLCEYIGTEIRHNNEFTTICPTIEDVPSNTQEIHLFTQPQSSDRSSKYSSYALYNKKDNNGDKSFTLIKYNSDNNLKLKGGKCIHNGASEAVPFFYDKELYVFAEKKFYCKKKTDEIIAETLTPLSINSTSQLKHYYEAVKEVVVQRDRPSGISGSAHGGIARDFDTTKEAEEAVTGLEGLATMLPVSVEAMGSMVANNNSLINMTKTIEDLNNCYRDNQEGFETLEEEKQKALAAARNTLAERLQTLGDKITSDNPQLLAFATAIQELIAEAIERGDLDGYGDDGRLQEGDAMRALLLGMRTKLTERHIDQ